MAPDRLEEGKEAWGMEETRSIDLNDQRLNRRLREVLAQLGNRPNASIPGACGGLAEMTATYRLFDNPKVSFERILAPHAEATRKRMALQQTVLTVQDTTELDLTRPNGAVQGSGPLDGANRRGMLLHLLHAFTPDGTPLGSLNASAWTREDEAREAPLTRAQRAATPLEQKESYRWIEMLRNTQQAAQEVPGPHYICIGDSEADIYEIFAEPLDIDWIVRGCQNRALLDESDDGLHLRERVLSQPVLYTQCLRVRGRTPKVACETRGRRQVRRSRKAQVEIRSACLTLRPPYRPDGKLPPTQINVVLVREIHPPEDDEPIEWILLTSLPVDSADQAREVVTLYCVRWMIEIFFRVLKSGCRIEERRFETLPRLQNCLAVYLIVAWRTLYVCRMGRSVPQIDCEAIFESAEWKSVYKVVRQSDPPDSPPCLGDMILMVAQLGGYVRRKNSPPGPQTVWIGLQRVQDFALCWNLFGPEASQELRDV